jgi:general secretion pathway protein G
MSAKNSLATAGQRTLQPRGFTLIELLVVIAIIAILAGLILQTAGYVQRKGATSRAEAEIAALSAALESYKADLGDYPRWTNLPGANNMFLLTNLMPTALTNKVYFEFNKSMTNASGIIDPFGTTYGYQYPGASNRSGTNFFDLWSTAGTSTSPTNSNRWLKNW